LPKCGDRATSKELSLNLEEIKIKLKFINPNLIILSDVYLNNSTKLNIKCLICGNIWDITWGDLLSGYGCPICAIERRSGESHYNWKGGITSLSNCLRDCICQWKKDSLKANNYRCIITGSTKDKVIHHLYGFDKILQETISITNLPIYQEINKYTDEQIRQLEHVCLNLHYKYGLGVVLTKDLHQEFQSIYGYGNNTTEQFEEFKRIKIRNINNKDLD